MPDIPAGFRLVEPPTAQIPDGFKLVTSSPSIPSGYRLKGPSTAPHVDTSDFATAPDINPGVSVPQGTTQADSSPAQLPPSAHPIRDKIADIAAVVHPGYNLIRGAARSIPEIGAGMEKEWAHVSENPLSRGLIIPHPASLIPGATPSQVLHQHPAERPYMPEQAVDAALPATTAEQRGEIIPNVEKGIGSVVGMTALGPAAIPAVTTSTIGEDTQKFYDRGMGQGGALAAGAVTGGAKSALFAVGPAGRALRGVESAGTAVSRGIENAAVAVGTQGVDLASDVATGQNIQWDDEAKKLAIGLPTQMVAGEALHRAMPSPSIPDGYKLKSPTETPQGVADVKGNPERPLPQDAPQAKNQIAVGEARSAGSERLPENTGTRPGEEIPATSTTANAPVAPVNEHAQALRDIADRMEGKTNPSVDKIGKSPVLDQGKNPSSLESPLVPRPPEGEKQQLPEEIPVPQQGSSGQIPEPKVVQPSADLISPPAPPVKGEPPKPVYRDTRAGGERFHGTSNPIEQLQDYSYNDQNIYGQGLYTTDDFTTANAYTKKGGGKEPSVYKIGEKRPAKMLDLEQPPTPEVHKILDSLGDRSWDSLGQFAHEIYKENPNAPVKRWFDEVRAASRSEGLSTDSVQELFQSVTDQLRDVGYDGYRHEGGNLAGRGKRTHDVKVYFDPASSVDIAKVNAQDYSAPVPAEPVAKESAQQVAQLGATKLRNETLSPAATGFNERNNVAQLDKPLSQSQPESGQGGARRKGVAYVPTAQDIAPYVGELRRIRERFSGVEGRYGSDVAKGFTKTVQSGVEARSIVRTMIKRTGADETTLDKLRAIGLDNRAKEMQARGIPASQVPVLSPVDAVAYRADPKVKSAMKWWNDNVAPELTDIRTRNGMILSSAPSKMDFFVNLVGEGGPDSGGGKTGTNLQEAFNKAAAGEGDYKSDPTDFFTSMVQQHLRTDASAQLAEAIKAKASVPPASVVDPLAKLNPTVFPAKPSNRYFTADFKGRKVEVEAINLNPNPNGTPDYHYVPRDVAKEFNNIRQPVAQHDTIFDKAMSVGTAASTFGSIAPHAWREISHVGSRIAESGQDLKSAIPWIGSKVAALKKMADLRDSNFGDTVQLLVDRSGGDKGVGWGVKPAKTKIGELLNKPHEMLFNPDTGFDPMMRRVVADAHLRTLLGPDAVAKIEADVNSGKLSPIEAARQIESKIKPEDFQGLGRQINNTLGWANKQTRSDLLNAASRVFPYISSESGMIPRELVSRVTRNVNPRALATMARNGQHAQMAASLLGSLATGAIGTYLAMNAINYASSKATTGKGQWMSENDEGHKNDVQVAPGWYWSNFDPMIARADRILGYKQAANDAPYSAGREAVNESLSTLNSGIRAAFTTFTGKTMRLNDQNQLDKSRSGMLDFVNAGRNTAQAIVQGKSLGAGAVKDVANLAGVQLQQSSGKNYTHAERMAKYLAFRPGEDLKPEQIAHMKDTGSLIDQMRGKPDQAESLVDAEIAKGKQPRDERSNLIYRASHGDLENTIKYRLSADDAVKIYKDSGTSDDERAKIKDLVASKIINSDKTSDQQDAMLKEADIDKPADLDMKREMTDLRRQQKEASSAHRPFPGAARLRMLEGIDRLRKGPKRPSR